MSMNFRALVDDARRRGRAAHLRPRTMSWAARQCGISTAHLYNLINGAKVAPEWTAHRIARGLDVPFAVVQRALEQSRAEAEVGV